MDTNLPSDPSPAPMALAKKPQATFIASLGYATNGVLRTLCTQRNMKVHWVSGTAVMLVGMALSLDLSSRASVMFCVGLVMCMEVLNTALEAFVDLHVKQYAHTAMVAKDAAAAAVLILSVTSVVVFADILLHSWSHVAASGEAIVRTVAAGVPLLVLLGVGLTMRRAAVLALLGLVAMGLVAYLAVHSRDEVFSAGAAAFVLTGFYARWAEPRLLGPGAGAPPTRAAG